MLKTHPFLAAIVCGSIAAAPLASQSSDHAARVDSLFSRWNTLASPGAAVAVVENGNVVLARGYGAANLEYDVPITPSTVFHVASVSKQFTAFALVLLAQQGEIALDDDIRVHVPEVPDFGTRITIRHLAHHTSGLRDQWNLLAMAGWRLDDVITREHILKLVSRQRELNFPPGSEYLYSNTGYTLMAEIVSRVTQQPFPEWMQENVFAPLGMASTLFYDDHERIVKNRAYSYGPDGDGFQKLVLSYANVGATSLFTTVDDMARWIANLRSHAVGGEAGFRTLTTRGVLTGGDTISYALGIGVGSHRDRTRIGHSGGDAGYRSYVGFFPELDLGVVVLSNLASFDPFGMATEVAEIFGGDRFGSPAATASETRAVRFETVALTDQHRRRYEGHYRLVEPNLYRRIYFEDGRLMYDRDGQSASPLVVLRDGRLMLLEGGTELVLAEVPVEPGQPKRFRWYDDGQPSSHLEAYEPWQPSEADIAALAGAYYSPELATSYTIAARDGNLVARHSRHPDIELAPRATDEMSARIWFMGNLMFERNADGTVTGFRASSGRVRHLLFTKER